MSIEMLTLSQELSGIFEMRVYDGDHSVGRILEECKVDTRGVETPPKGVVHGIDLAKLNQRLNTMDVPEIRRRRANLEHFSQEVLVSADPDRGIRFTSCLMILAHYNIITDKNSLRLEEFLRRRSRLQRVQEQVRRNVVIGFFDTLHYSRKLRRSREARHSARMVTVPQFAVPEIFVEGQDWQSPVIDVFPPSPDISPRGSVSDSGSHSLGPDISTSPPSPSGLRHRGESFGNSPTRSDHNYNVSPILGPRRPSYDPDDGMDTISFDGPLDRSPSNLSRTPSRRHRRQNSSVDERLRRSPQTQTFSALEVFDNSAWGESIRRSFTMRRNGTRARGLSQGEQQPP